MSSQAGILLDLQAPSKTCQVSESGAPLAPASAHSLLQGLNHAADAARSNNQVDLDNNPARGLFAKLSQSISQLTLRVRGPGLA